MFNIENKTITVSNANAIERNNGPFIIIEYITTPKAIILLTI